jgi:hypothetical protein
MENIQSKVSTPISNRTNNLFSNKNIIIFVLVIILLSPFILPIVNFIFYNIIGFLSFATGNILDKSSNAITDGAKFGIDIANGTVHDISDIVNKTSDSISDASKFAVDIANGTVNDVGNLFMGQSNATEQTQTEKFTQYLREPEPDSSASIIQSPISSNNMSWCLVGEMAGRRSCVSVDEQTKCMSGQTFPNQFACTNIVV